MKDRISTVAELFGFLKSQKMWWLIPVIAVFLVFGILIFIVGSSPLAPIIYPLF